MASTMSTVDQAKQSMRQMLAIASDKMKIASASLSKSDQHDIDIAVVKSTASQFHVVPKEKHVRTLKQAVHPSADSKNRKYVIAELIKRLHNATDWLTALKALMVVHRLLREGDVSFLEELLKFSEAVTQGKGHVLDMTNFIDTTNIEGRFDYSEWVRAYGNYLDQQLEVYARINYYQEQEHSGEQSRMRGLAPKDLLFQMPHLQRLLQRLLACQPGGVAARDPVVQGALITVLKESFKIYKAISEGLINLADCFFEMEYLDASKGLEVYKEAMLANDRLQQYYHAVEQIEELKRAVQFPKLEAPPADFLTQMEAYVKEAPRPLEDAAAGGKKRSPPLRRGSKLDKPAAGRASMAVGVRASAESDPGMLLAPGVAKLEIGGRKDGGADLLEFANSPMAGAAAAPSANGSAAGSAATLDDLLGGSSNGTVAADPFSDAFGGPSSGFAPAAGAPLPKPAVATPAAAPPPAPMAQVAAAPGLRPPASTTVPRTAAAAQDPFGMGGPSQDPFAAMMAQPAAAPGGGDLMSMVSPAPARPPAGSANPFANGSPAVGGASNPFGGAPAGHMGGLGGFGTSSPAQGSPFSSFSSSSPNPSPAYSPQPAAKGPQVGGAQLFAAPGMPPAPAAPAVAVGSGYRKDAGAHDPFAELTGLGPRQPKVAPPLKAPTQL